MTVYVWSETVEEKGLLRLDKHAGLSRLNRVGTKDARKMLKPYLGPYHVFMFLDFIMSNEFRFDVCSKWKQFELTSQTLGTSDKYLAHNNPRLIRNTHHLRAGHKAMEKTLTATKPENAQGKKKTRRRGPRLTGVSRQRRMANARERSRVQNLNAHIERLRDLIPLFPGEKKPSKTETIRLAAVYISCLTDILETAPEGLGSRISADELIPTFPALEDSLSLAGLPPLPKFCFEPFSDEGKPRLVPWISFHCMIYFTGGLIILHK